MKKILAVALVAVLGFGCKRKKPEEGIEPPQAPPVTAGSASGSAATPAKPLTAEETTKRIDECWGYWNNAKYDALLQCFTPDATAEAPGSGMPIATGAGAVVESTKFLKGAFPEARGEIQLQLLSGTNVVSVVLTTGTQTGPFETPMGKLPATNKKIGFMSAQVLELDGVGHAKREANYFDLATLLGQVSPIKDHPVRAAIDKLPMARETVVAKDDATEKANLATAKAATDAYNKHEMKAFGDLLTDDSTWSEQAGAKDWTKKETLAQAAVVWKAFSDLKINPSASWAAGDYVVTIATMEGTNDGALPEMGIKAKTGKRIVVPLVAIHKLDKGKIKMTWIFDQGLAFASQMGLLPPPPAAAGSAAK